MKQVTIDLMNIQDLGPNIKSTARQGLKNELQKFMSERQSFTLLPKLAEDPEFDILWSFIEKELLEAYFLPNGTIVGQALEVIRLAYLSARK